MSAEPGNVFARRFPNQMEPLCRAIDEAVRFLETRGVAAQTTNLAHLVIEEMATNIIKYGYDDPAPHEILLQVRIEPGMLQVVLEDDGHEFNPLAAPPPDVNLPLEQREPGGLGIHLIRSLAAHMDYQRCNGRNRLTACLAG